MSNQIVYLNETTFDSTIKSATKPVLVDFWADWCGPCKMLAPILDDIAATNGDKVIIAKVNVDENPSISPKFGIRGIPTLLLFKNGEVVATQVGALSKLQLQTFLDNNI